MQFILPVWGGLYCCTKMNLYVLSFFTHFGVVTVRDWKVVSTSGLPFPVYKLCCSLGTSQLLEWEALKK